MRKWLVCVGAVAIAVVPSGCGSSESSDASSAASSSSSSAATSSGVATATEKLKQYQQAPVKIIQTEPLKSPPAPGKTVAMLGTNDPSNVLIQQELRRVAELVGWNYVQASYDPANPASFTSALDSALAKDPDYVIEAGLPLTPQALKKVEDAGAKWVVTAVHPVEVKAPVIAATNAYANNAQMGKVLAYYFVSDSRGKGSAVIEHVPSYPILGAFTDAFQETVKSLCPDCKMEVVDLTLPQVAGGKIPSAMVSALKTNPSADYLVFDYGPFANGINSALDGAGLSKIKVIGQAADPAAIQALTGGTQAAWTGFQPIYQSYALFDAMFRDVAGLPIDQEQAALQPTQILTQDNIGTVNLEDGSWAEPADVFEQFKALWSL
jgi:ribose transport system substrate-binding protein